MSCKVTFWCKKKYFTYFPLDMSCLICRKKWYLQNMKTVTVSDTCVLQVMAWSHFQAWDYFHIQMLTLCTLSFANKK